MFEIGDYVAHYKQGICEVVTIGKLDIGCSDNEKEYYTLNQSMMPVERSIHRWIIRDIRSEVY